MRFGLKVTPLLIPAILAITGCASTSYPPMTTVASVDVPGYMGAWYQQALIPNRFQSMCVADTQALYELKSTGEITVTNRCRTESGQIEKAVGIAKAVEGSAGAKLKVSFFRPFYGDYWVLALDPDASQGWVLVGEPSRKYAWIMSREPELNKTSFESAMAQALSAGYTREQFVTSPQRQPLEKALN